MVLDILTTVFLIVASFTLGVMGEKAARDDNASKDEGEAYANGYKEGYKNAMSYVLTALTMVENVAGNSDT